jgi:hypothetical protein
VRVNLRVLPWLLAFIGLAVPLVGSRFALWLPISVWLVVLVVAWLSSRRLAPTREQQIIGAVVLLPILFLLAFEGGWWLIPADLAWLALALADRDKPRGNPIGSGTSI